MPAALRTPLLWLTLVVISLACALGAIRFFPLSFPLVSVDITMDRQAALQQASKLAERFDWGPEGYRSAASYSHDADVQHFVELTAGGVDAYRELLADGLYSPYTWAVRLFREGETEQTRVRFTPDGVPYGFSVDLPEESPGEVLTAMEARNLAEAAAREHWRIHWQSFEPLESSEELKPGGRLDHIFTYRRQDAELGEGEYRMRLRVSGDRFTELTHFVHIPQTFQRQYDEMRSRNNALAAVARIATGALFFFGGCVVGLFFMVRQGYLIWRTPVLWGVGIGLLLALTHLNALPLQWMGYDTATSMQNHLLLQIVVALTVFGFWSGLFSLIFMAAESLSRCAFPQHIQLWKTWHRGVAPSYQVLGMTCLGLLLVAPLLLYATTGYWFTTRTLGWWVPSSQLFHPDTLAQFQPWLPALVGPLMAAFTEEALFRAVPIASAVLLGRRFGGTRYWLIAAVLLQAMLFAAVHANYPQQPYYARALELILPALLFAALYIRFGLYPAILLHFWYNLIWFSMPVFAASSPGIWLDQTLIILLALTPVWIVLFQWWRQGRLGQVPDSARNGHWQPAAKTAPEPKPAVEAVVTGQLSSKAVVALLLAGLVGLALWSSQGQFTTQAPPVTIDRTEAEQLAEQALAGFDRARPEGFRVFSRTWGGPTDQHRLVWQESGEPAYGELMGNHLAPPLWYVRWARFDGEQEERAEEFRIHLQQDGGLHGFYHILPDSRPGAELAEEQARVLAEAALAQAYGVDPTRLERIDTDFTQHPERADWEFTYADPGRPELARGQARLRARIGGDQVTTLDRFIHVPEEWSRQQREVRALPNIVQGVIAVLFVLALIGAAVLAIVRWSGQSPFHVKSFLVLGGLLLGLMLVTQALDWPSNVIGFVTTEAYAMQFWIAVGFGIFGLLMVCGTFGLIAGLLHSARLPLASSGPSLPAVLGCALAAALVALGLGSLVDGFNPYPSPYWGQINPVASLQPVLSTALAMPLELITAGLFVLMVFASAHWLSGGWQKRRPLTLGLLVLIGYLIAGRHVPSLSIWLAAGAAWGLFLCLTYIGLLRHHLPLVVPAVAALAILGNLQQLASPMYAGSAAGYLLGSALTAVLAAGWYFSLVGRRGTS